MDPNIKKYVINQAKERQPLLTQIHSIIVEEDKTVIPMVSLMMGKEMIIYSCNGIMKYGLAGFKNYMSLHIMPIYGSTTLYAKYKALLNKASFQKGCINFDTADKMPLNIVRQLIADSAPINLQKLKEDYLKQKASPKG